MRFKMIRLAGLVSVLALAAGCSDSPTAARAPQATAVAAPQEMGLARLVATKTFTITPGQATLVSWEDGYVYIQADALCDGTSGYGRAYFDQPCARETQSQSFVAMAGFDAKGLPSLVFNRDVRFSPDKYAFVVLTSQRRSAERGSAILWYDRDARNWVDEGAYDRDQLTYWSNNGKTLWRRLKHFSGYNVGAGVCDPSIDPSCGGGELAPPSF